MFQLSEIPVSHFYFLLQESGKQNWNANISYYFYGSQEEGMSVGNGK